MAVATPVIAYVTSLLTNKAISNTANYTITVNIPSAWQVNIPIRIGSPHTTGVSLGAQIFVYRSTDGGVSFDTVALQPMGLPRPTAADITQQASIKLETGSYVIQIQAGGNGTATTWTLNVGTYMVITAVLNA